MAARWRCAAVLARLSARWALAASIRLRTSGARVGSGVGGGRVSSCATVSDSKSGPASPAVTAFAAASKWASASMTSRRVQPSVDTSTTARYAMLAPSEGATPAAASPIAARAGSVRFDPPPRTVTRAPIQPASVRAPPAVAQRATRARTASASTCR